MLSSNNRNGKERAEFSKLLIFICSGTQSQIQKVIKNEKGKYQRCSIKSEILRMAEGFANESIQRPEIIMNGIVSKKAIVQNIGNSPMKL